MQNNNDILDAVYKIIQERKKNPSEKSYVASLHAKGLDKILGKIGEEATEVAIAGKGGKKGGPMAGIPADLAAALGSRPGSR